MQNWIKGKGGVIALAVLVCGMAFAALAGPAQSLHTRTQALQQTMAALPVTTKTVQATIAYSTLNSDITSATDEPDTGISEDTFSAAEDEIAASVRAAHVPLGPGAWTGIATKGLVISSGYGPGVVERKPPEFVFDYRDTLAAHSRLVAGSLTPGPSAPATALAVTTTAATATRFGVHPGSVLKVEGNLIYVTGIIAVVDPASVFWQFDVAAMTPTENSPLTAPQWIGEVFADPGQLGTMTTMFGGASQVTWVYPVDPAGVNADQLQGFYSELNHVSTMTPALSGSLQDVSDDLAMMSPLTAPVEAFLQTQAAVLAVLLLLFVSLGAIGVAVIFLAARMIVDRRQDELIMLRARGASSRQIAVMLARSAGLAALAAAIVGAAIAVALISSTGQSAVIGWTLTAVTVVVATAAPAVIATWRHRRPAPAANPARIMTAETRTTRFSGRVLRRIIVEITACGAAIAGLAVLRGQGVAAAGSTNWFLTLAPILVAVPAVVITLRLYPLLVRVALHFARRRASATSYVALAASARTSLATAGPVFALVLALTLAAFAGMITDSIGAAQTAQSWQTTGADAVGTTNGAVTVTPAIEHAVEAVHGVQHVAAVWATEWTTPGGQAINAFAVNPEQYAALSAGTPFPAVHASALGGSGGTLSVLASPAAAAALGHGGTQLSSIYYMGPIQVHVAGTIASTPADPSSTGAWILIPLQTLPGVAGNGTPVPNTILITGTGIDRAQLNSALNGADFSVVYRADVLASLTKSPLQHGAVTLMLLTALAAAAFALLNLILGLALGAAERDLTLARLTVMGVPHSSRLALTETIPAVLAAIIASIVCALALPPLTGGALDLSVFTTSDLTTASVAVSLQPDLISVCLPAAILLILTAATLVIQTRATRYRGPSSLLRAG
jgi:putative ABC transport system permease protein